MAWARVMVGKMERRGGSGCPLVTVQACWIGVGNSGKAGCLTGWIVLIFTTAGKTGFQTAKWQWREAWARDIKLRVSTQ